MEVKKHEMKITFRNLLLLISVSVFISCNGQETKEKRIAQEDINSEIAKIPMIPKGFSNGFVDFDGTLWFASNGGGIYHYDGKTTKHFTEKDGLSSNQVFSIIGDRENNLWFGTQRGLVRYDRQHFEHIPLPYQDTTGLWLEKVYPMINPNAAHSLATDNNGHLWIGTAGGGAYRYDGKTFTSYLTEIGQKQEDSLHHNWVPFIRKDHSGHLWFASMTHGGLNRYDGQEFTQYAIKDGLSDDQIRTILCDKTGNIWIGFNGNRNSGLTVYDGDSFKTYSTEDGLCNTRIRSICEDKHGKLWIGADLGNLCVFDGQTFTEFQSNGQSFSDVLFIFSDQKDQIWFGGPNGIWKYDGETVAEMTTGNF